jgi:hypothetical protein
MTAVTGSLGGTTGKFKGLVSKPAPDSFAGDESGLAS